MRTADNGWCSPGRLTSDPDGDRWCRACTYTYRNIVTAAGVLCADRMPLSIKTFSSDACFREGCRRISGESLQDRHIRSDSSNKCATRSLLACAHAVFDAKSQHRRTAPHPATVPTTVTNVRHRNRLRRWTIFHSIWVPAVKRQIREISGLVKKCLQHRSPTCNLREAGISSMCQVPDGRQFGRSGDVVRQVWMRHYGCI
jgi:hypothetical protein